MHVLIADRHDLFRLGLVTILNELNTPRMSFKETGSLPGLVQLMEQDDFDLVIAGLNVLQEKGFRALNEVRQQYLTVPILAIIENPTSSIVDELRRYKLNGIIAKSASKASYLNALNSLLMGDNHFPPRSSKRHFKFSGNQELFPGILTRRQEEVLFLLSDGKSNREIATLLHLSEGTVKVHVTAIFKALGVKNRTQAMLIAQHHRDRNLST